MVFARPIQLELASYLVYQLLVAWPSAGTASLPAYACPEPSMFGNICAEADLVIAASWEAEDAMGLMQVMPVSVLSSQKLEIASGAPSATCGSLKSFQNYFTLSVEAGTPRQMFDLVVDTGSNALIVPDCICKQSGYCGHAKRCFDATKSTSFSWPGVERKTDESQLFTAKITYGSGDIFNVVGSDTVRAAGVDAIMEKGVYLMEDRRTLKISNNFEGIFPLGLPSAHARMYGKLWTEGANVKKYTLCFNQDSTGTFVANVPSLANPMANLGKTHWGLDLQGMSVGRGSTYVPVLSKEGKPICSPSSKKASMQTACGAIPDSGTTFVLGPQHQITQLFQAICEEWPRCVKEVAATGEEKHLAFQSLLRRCGKWLTKEDGIGEIPSILLHLAGKHGVAQQFPLSPAAFIVESTADLAREQTFSLFGRINYTVSVPTGERAKTCTAAFGKHDMNTAENGPVWIFGMPLFYDYTIGYDISTETGAISIDNAACTACEPALLSTGADSRVRSAIKMPRRVNGPLREPSIDPSSPF